MNQIQQLFIVVCALMALPLAFKLLAKLHLIPLGMYFLAAKLVFPEWAVSHKLICIGLFVLYVAYTAGLWVLWYMQRKREEEILTAQLLARARPLYEFEDYEQV